MRFHAVLLAQRARGKLWLWWDLACPTVVDGARWLAARTGQACRRLAKRVLVWLAKTLLSVVVLVALTVGTWKAVPITLRNAVTNRLVPGIEVNGAAQLDRKFRDALDRVLTRLEGEGHDPVVAVTFRDRTRQDFIYALGRIIQNYGGPPVTNAIGGRSCHNHTTDDGTPAALAADIQPSRGRLVERVVFFKALGAAAQAEGLRWGGAWSKRNPYWKKHGLGWDPGHVQSARCRK